MGRRTSLANPPQGVGEVTRLLAACSEGEQAAFDRLMGLVYDDLRRIAHARLRDEREGHTLNTTAVVHECYLRLVNEATTTWRDRAHFIAAASRAIRHILIDYARRTRAEKRGGGAVHSPLRDQVAGGEERTVELLELDEALRSLAEHDRRLERVVECGFFGGMTAKETAEALGTSLRTVERDWARAKAYLFDALS
jgi:RNA polymerase sigma factor (TIGR02999 family)